MTVDAGHGTMMVVGEEASKMDGWIKNETSRTCLDTRRGSDASCLQNMQCRVGFTVVTRTYRDGDVTCIKRDTEA